MKKIISVFTFLVVTGMVFTGAVSTIRLSLLGNTNEKLIASLIKSSRYNVVAMNSLDEKILGASNEAVEENQDNGLTCETIVSYSGTSLVNYLHETSNEWSFSRRTELALKNGISDYKGTSEQNSLLLNKLLQAQRTCRDIN